MTTVWADHVRRQGRTALLAIGKLLWLLEIVRTATAGAGVALPALRNGHCLFTSRDPPTQMKPQILIYPGSAVNRGEAVGRGNYL